MIIKGLFFMDVLRWGQGWGAARFFSIEGRLMWSYLEFVFNFQSLPKWLWVT
jgi:hypothetical protein